MGVVMLQCLSTREGSSRRSMPKTSHFQTQRAQPTLSSSACSSSFGILFHLTQPSGPAWRSNARVSPRRPPLVCHWPPFICHVLFLHQPDPRSDRFGRRLEGGEEVQGRCVPPPSPSSRRTAHSIDKG